MGQVNSIGSGVLRLNHNGRTEVAPGPSGYWLDAGSPGFCLWLCLHPQGIKGARDKGADELPPSVPEVLRVGSGANQGADAIHYHRAVFAVGHAEPR